MTNQIKCYKLPKIYRLIDSKLWIIDCVENISSLSYCEISEVSEIYDCIKVEKDVWRVFYWTLIFSARKSPIFVEWTYLKISMKVNTDRSSRKCWVMVSIWTYLMNTWRNLHFWFFVDFWVDFFKIFQISFLSRLYLASSKEITGTYKKSEFY